MSAQNITKVISIRVPAIYFRRLGFLAYHQGKLPSEAAREIIIAYLNLGCLQCGGPICQWEGFDVDPIAICVNPGCDGRIEGRENLMPIEDFADGSVRNDLPGFSE